MIDHKLADSGLIVGHMVIEGLENKKNRSNALDRKVKELEQNVKENPGSFLENPNTKAYTAIGAEESGSMILVNLIMQRGKLPTISRIVDCMNIISVCTGLTISIWDKDNIHGDIVYRHAQGGEKYWPFMGEETELAPQEIAAFDSEKTLCLVRYRDSKYASVMPDTKNIIVHIQSVKPIEKEAVQKALDDLEVLLHESTGGTTTEKRMITT